MIKKTLRPPKESYGELMSLLDLSFSFDDGNFLRFLPKLYREENEPWRYNYAVSIDGRLVSAVGAYPDTLVVGDEALSVCGIGNVAVHPDFRGYGYMTELLDLALDDMGATGTDISLLGGDRFRYGYFGYEPSCPSFDYVIERRILEKHLHISPLGIHEIVSADDPCLEDVYALHRTRGLRFVRKREKLFEIMRSYGRRIFTVADGTAILGYCVTYGESIDEITLTSPEYLGTFLLSVMDAYSARSLKLSLGETDVLNSYAEKLSSSRLVSNSSGLCVLCWKNVINAFLRLKAKHESLPDMKYVFLINGIRRTERISVSIKDGEVQVTETGEDADITLGAREAVSLMFSQSDSARRSLPPEVRAIFPLPMFLTGADAV